MKDEELQNNIEKGDMDLQGTDARLYRQIFATLEKTPTISLSNKFADGVIEKIVRKKEKKEAVRDLVLLMSGIVSLIIVLIIALAFVKLNIELNFLGAFMNYKGLIVFAALIIALLNIIERKLLRPQGK